MPHIGVRMPETLVEQIDNDAGPEQSRSEYVRQAVRAQLRADDDMEQIEDQIEDLNDRLENLDHRLEELENDGWLF